MQVILFGVHLEVVKAGRYRIVMVRNLNHVVNDVARMGHPLPANHELVLNSIAKCVGRTPMPASEAGSAVDRVQQAAELFVADRAHGIRL